MEYRVDIVSELQHSLMNAHVIIGRMKAISRQLNASHTLLLMKQSSSSDQLAEHVQNIRHRLEVFHEEMIHQLTKSFQEKTEYLNTCLRQLQHEEGTIVQLCNETEGLLKLISTKTVNPVQIQRGKTLLEAFRIISKENSSDLELDEDVLCLDFIPLKAAEEYTTFGNIRVNCSTVQTAAVSNTNVNKQTKSRSSQTEILFKDYCPFCGRSYSKGKQDEGVQATVSCVDCGSQSDIVESETFWKNKLYKGEKIDLDSIMGKKLAMDSIDEKEDKRKTYLQSLKTAVAPPNVCLVRKVLDNIGMVKQATSDESSSSYPDDTAKMSNGVNTLTEEKPRRRMPLAARKLKNMNDKHMEEIWNSSDEEMEEATKRLSNPLTFAAAVKHLGEGDKEKRSRSKTPEIQTTTDTATQNYLPPPPPGFDKIPVTMVTKTLEEKPKPRKPVIAVESLSMLTGLMKNVKVENAVHLPRNSKEDVQENSDWWGESPRGQQPQMSPIQSHDQSADRKVTLNKNGVLSVNVPDCWLDEESDSVSCNSVTSTPKVKRESVRFQSETKREEKPEEFRLRRPSLSLVTSPRAAKPKENTDTDTNNNFRIADKVQPVDQVISTSNHLTGNLKAEKIETVPVEDSGVCDDWVEESPGKVTTTFVKGSEIWTETVTDIKVTTTGTTRSTHVPVDNNKVYQARNDRETGADKRKVVISTTDTKSMEKSKIHTAKDDWEPAKPKVQSSKDDRESAKIQNAKDDWETAKPIHHAKNDLEPAKPIWRAKDDWEPQQSKVNSSKDDWESECNPADSKQMVTSYNVRQEQEAMETSFPVTKEDTTIQSVCKAPNKSPVASYIEEKSKGAASKILPPIPAKLKVKIGGREGGLHFPIGVATTSKMDVIVADTGNDLVKIFTMDGKLKLIIGASLNPKMKRPSAVVINDKDEVFVKDDVCIRAFEVNGGLLLKKMGINQLTCPYGLSWTPEGHLLTLDVDKRNPRIVIFSQKGDLVNSFPYTPLKKNYLPHTRCRFLDVNKDTLVVSDLGRHEIYVTDLQGKLKTYFGRGGYGNGEFFEPSGVIVDSNGNMIIADSKNDRVQVFRPDGGFVCIIGFSEPIKRPSDMHLTKDGHLIVVNFLNHLLKVYKLGDS